MVRTKQDGANGERVSGSFVPSEEAAQYLPYNYGSGGHEGVAESQSSFAYVEAPGSNASSLSGQAAIAKRRDQARKKKQTAPILAVRKFTITT